MVEASALIVALFSRTKVVSASWSKSSTTTSSHDILHDALDLRKNERAGVVVGNSTSDGKKPHLGSHLLASNRKGALERDLHS